MSIPSNLEKSMYNRPKRLRKKTKSDKTQNQILDKLNTDRRKPCNLKTISYKNCDRSRSLLITGNVEFYPNRPKRKVLMKKIELEPKYEYKVIATTNKRKRTIPRKEENLDLSRSLLLPITNSNLEEEQSVEDLVRLAEEHGLNDEDLMEILTCPSPVWWEDLTEDQEDIHIRFHEASIKEDYTRKEILHTRIEQLNENNILLSDKKQPNAVDISKNNFKSESVNFFKQFVEKRSKLESVLGNIKLKKTKPDQFRCFDKSDSGGSIKNEFVNTKPELNLARNDTKDEIDITFELIEPNQSFDKHESRDKINKNRCESVGGLSDTSINEDELLNTLENIKIPVQKLTTSISDNEFKAEKTDTEKISNGVQNNVSNKTKTKQRMRKQILNAKDMSNEVSEIELDPHEDLDPRFRDVGNEIMNMTNNHFGNIDAGFTCVSPKSMDSNASDVTNCSIIEFDSISDTNIKFLDEIEEITESNRPDTNEFVKNEIKLESKHSELVTVYRILTNQNADIEDEIKANLVCKTDGNVDQDSVNLNRVDSELLKSNTTSYDKLKNGCDNKKRRTVQKKKQNVPRLKVTRKIVLNVDTDKTLKVPNSKVLYCLKCSSIFETDSCQYCLNKS